jgi:23S rRNA (uracil1939-C5)-methyltransferase
MSRKLPPQFEVKIDGLSKHGEGTGLYGNRRVFVFGSMPGETVLVKPLKKTRRSVKAEILELLKPDPERLAPREDHFLSCSPWQVIPYGRQLIMKKNIVNDLFAASSVKHPPPEIEPSDRTWHYRNKMEFGFTSVGGKISLSFHRRTRRFDRFPLDSCAIANEKINSCAAYLVGEFNRLGLPLAKLKYLIIRCSDLENKALAALYVNDLDFPRLDIAHPDLAGLMVIYSDPLSPSSVGTEALYSSGREYLEEKMGGQTLKFNYDGFFQVNPAVFGRLIDYLKRSVRPGRRLTDFYSGVGTIGLALASSFKEVIGIEYDRRAVRAARENAAKNGITHIRFESGEAEKQDLKSILSATDVLAVDPPRSGLHPKLVKAILADPPARFIYISCNPVTQAADMASLNSSYRISHHRLFDLYPHTPHVESVLLCERRNRIVLFLSGFKR